MYMDYTTGAGIMANIKFGTDGFRGVIADTFTFENVELINGVYQIGTIVFDRDGCIAILNDMDPDGDIETDDYGVNKLFSGGNF